MLKYCLFRNYDDPFEIIGRRYSTKLFGFPYSIGLEDLLNTNAHQTKWVRAEGKSLGGNLMIKHTENGKLWLPEKWGKLNRINNKALRDEHKKRINTIRLFTISLRQQCTYIDIKFYLNRVSLQTASIFLWEAEKIGICWIIHITKIVEQLRKCRNDLIQSFNKYHWEFPKKYEIKMYSRQ